MTRTEFKEALSGLVDEIVDTDRELTDDDVDALNDQLGDITNDLLADEENEDTQDDGDGA